MNLNTLRQYIHYKVALLGRPNVGKSSLFNALLGHRLALVDTIPGFTRDCKEARSKIGSHTTYIDTPGIDISLFTKQHSLLKLMCYKSLNAAINADRVLFIIDGNQGIFQTDLMISKLLDRKQLHKKTWLVVNKSDQLTHDFYNQVYRLGMGQARFVSAQSGEGVLQLQQQLQKELPSQTMMRFEQIKLTRRENFKNMLQNGKQNIESLPDSNYQLFQEQMKKKYPHPSQDSEFDSPRDILRRPIRMTFMGRPNVGKSSLVNRIINVEKILVHEKAGTTRDSIMSKTEIDGRNFQIIDTAGYLNPKKDELWQGKVYADVHRALYSSDVAVYVIESKSALTTKDFSIIQRIIKSGKGIVIAANKWDLFDQKLRNKFQHYYKKQINCAVAQLNGVPFVKVSALTSPNFNQLLREVIQINDKMRKRIPTGRLNNWLHQVKKVSKVPNRGLKVLSLKVIYQIQTRPPTFILFVNEIDLARKSYLTFLKRKLAEQFGLEGVVIRMRVMETRKSLKERLGERHNQATENPKKKKKGKEGWQDLFQSEQKDEKIP